MSRQDLKKVIESFSNDKLKTFFRNSAGKFRPVSDSIIIDEDKFTNAIKIGEIEFPDDRVVICSFLSESTLTERSSRTAQYNIGKKILKEQQYDAGIFVFYDEEGSFRFSLIYTNYFGKKRDWSIYKRFTYYVNKSKSNKTFLNQIGSNEFNDLDDIKAGFSLKEVTDEFYNDFSPVFQKISASVTSKHGKVIQKEKEDFALLFVIRTIFIGFIQKRKWIGDDENFLEYFLNEFESCGNCGELYNKWIRPLFFESLNSAPGTKTSYRNNEFSDELEKKLQLAPYLNGGLFSEDKEIDRKDYFIPDEQIKEFFDFLFQYNFTIEENTLYDEELELNPEFLGIIFERLVNKADGAVYTPRTEVDMMCRLSLVKWLFKNNNSKIQKRDLYELFFKEIEEGEENQRYGSFSEKQYKEIIELLEKVTVCDPAVGSGAFLVGMMQVIDDIETYIYQERLKEKVPCTFERKKRIISQSLYGVEVKEWAVWIAQLRLWISLFIDAPEDMKNSFEPILPSLDFKVRQGDSLIQMIGSKQFPITGHADISSSIKGKVTKLKNQKVDFFYNKKGCLNKQMIKQKEIDIFREILDDEISFHKKEIKQMKDDSKGLKQESLFGEVIEDKKEPKLDLFKKEIEDHQAEIEELQSQKESLRQNKPLIWAIEFSEIFVENGGFDVIIGNPPYVRQEEIADPLGKVEDNRKYKKLLAEMVRIDFPDHFIEDRKINAQSDLYTYFYIRSLKLLNTKGIHTFICSNSWLDVGYGAWLQEFLLENATIEMIIDNHAKRSFDAADVNTIISIINAPIKHNKIDDNHPVKFIAFKRPFEETIFSEYLLNIENANQIDKCEQYRVFPVSIKELKKSGSEYENEEDQKLETAVGKYVGDKWGGKYLRSPDVFFKILEKGAGKLIELGKISIIQRGFTTGVNSFFYLNIPDVRKLKIEDKYLKPIIKSPRELKRIIIANSDLSYLMFDCHIPKSKLKNTEAFKYIKWGESQKYHLKPTTKGRNLWYSLEMNIIPNFAQGQIFNDRHFFSDVTGYPSDCVLNQIALDKEHKKYNDEILLTLNSTLTALFSELYGRNALGEGALKLQVFELRKIQLLSYKFIGKSKLKILQKMKQREIKSVFDECGIDPRSEVPIDEQEPNPLPDRKELDKIVFDALDLTEDERREIYRSVCHLVWNRINRANSVNRR